LIAAIETNEGYSIARDGQVLKVEDKHGHYVPAYFTASDVSELRSALASIPTPVTTTALTPAKAVARMRERPAIMRYPVKGNAAQAVH